MGNKQNRIIWRILSIIGFIAGTVILIRYFESGGIALLAIILVFPSAVLCEMKFQTGSFFYNKKANTDNNNKIYRMENDFSKWLDKILNKFNKKAVAFNFNIYENEKDFSVELVATDSFDQDNDDWATNKIYASRNDKSEFSFFALNWKEALRITESYIKQYLLYGNHENLLRSSKAVACGFVDGDLKIIYLNESEITKEKINECLKHLKPFSKIAKNLVYTNENTFSKIGGFPDVPDDFKWPQYEHGSLPFVMQLKLSEINTDSKLKSFPKSGLLYVFFDEDAFYRDLKDNKSWRILFHDETNETKEASGPKDLKRTYDETHVTTRIIRTFPDIEDCKEIQELVSKIPYQYIYYDYIETVYEENIKHQLGGWPYPIQSGNMEECKEQPNEDDWILLLQIDSDEENNAMMWGDSGMLYFYIREKDLIARDFNNVKLFIQCF